MVTRCSLKTVASYSPVRLMYEKKTNQSNLLIVRLIVWCTLRCVKYSRSAINMVGLLLPIEIRIGVSYRYYFSVHKLGRYIMLVLSIGSGANINQSIFWTRLSLGGRGGSSSNWSLQASRSSATKDRCSAGMPRRDQLRSST